MPPSTTTKTVVIRVDAGASQTQLKAVADGMKQINRDTKQMAGNLNLLTGAFSSFIGFLGVRQIIAFSDEMQSLNSRMILLTGSQESATSAMQKLLDLSDRANTSVSELGQTYSRLAVTLSEVGATSSEIIDLVEVLTNSFRIAGATSTETASTIVQLSQSFSSGVLRGQELRSVMLQNATLAKLLRERFGANLMKDAEAGLIRTTAFLEILLKHQNDINESAKKLEPTFEQTYIKALGRAKYSIGEVNRELGLSTGFATVMGEAMDRLGIIVTVLALVTLPLLITSLTNLATAIKVFSLSNPVTAGFVAGVVLLGIVISATHDSTQDFMDTLRRIGAWMLEFAASASRLGAAIYNLGNTLRSFIGLTEDLRSGPSKVLYDIGTDLNQAAARLRPNLVELRGKAKEENDGNLASLARKQAERDAAMAAGAGTARDALAELNKEYLFGTLNVTDYNTALAEIELKKLNEEFVKGKKDLDAYTAGRDALERKDLSKQLTAGTISLKEFNEQVEATKIETLNAKLAEGSIALSQYNEELSKISNKLGPGGVLAVGAQSYLDSLGTVSSQVADAIKGAFSSLETSFMGFVKTGKFEFAKFTEAILDDLLKIVIRASILQPLASGITGLFTAAPTGAAGGAYTQYPTPLEAAKGKAFSGGKVLPFARGGVVSSPTMFGYGSGKNGIMGEAGPEAILPLSRGKGGNLGVQAVVTPVTINIVNNTPAEVQSTETTGPNGERQIEVLINQRVKEGIASGAYDKSFQSSYGLKRKGS